MRANVVPSVSDLLKEPIEGGKSPLVVLCRRVLRPGAWRGSDPSKASPLQLAIWASQMPFIILRTAEPQALR